MKIDNELNRRILKEYRFMKHHLDVLADIGLQHHLKPLAKECFKIYTVLQDFCKMMEALNTEKKFYG